MGVPEARRMIGRALTRILRMLNRRKRPRDPSQGWADRRLGGVAYKAERTFAVGRERVLEGRCVMECPTEGCAGEVDTDNAAREEKTETGLRWVGVPCRPPRPPEPSDLDELLEWVMRGGWTAGCGHTFTIEGDLPTP